MKRFSLAFLVIFGVLLVHAFGLFVDAYHAISWFDVPMHFMGGYAMALVGLACWHALMDRVEIREQKKPYAHGARLAIEAMFVVGFALFIGVAWEWFEFVVDHVATTFVAKYGAAQMGLADTMDDLVNDTIGAITAWLLWRSRE